MRELINCRAKAPQWSILATLSNIFEMQQHYVCILFMFHGPIRWLL